MKKMTNKLCSLLDIEIPIIQAGMVWCSGWKMARAVSETGALGVIGAGSMSIDILEEHISKFQSHCTKPFAVNLPLLYQHVDKQIELVIAKKVPIVITSAGNPKTFTPLLKNHGIKVLHVVSSSKFALKAEESGVDAVIAEGFEAGGHNGREETTTLCLIPSVCQAVKLPVVAAGGIASGKAMAAAFALGAVGVQIGSRFAISNESSAHPNFKQKVIQAQEGDTQLILKKLTPVRMLKNSFFHQIKKLEDTCASEDELKNFLGKGRTKLGIFEGDLENGELEIGQVSALLNKVESCAEIVYSVWNEFLETCTKLYHLNT
jgi:enoyl-[acyl-carrier protein] reductase II